MTGINHIWQRVKRVVADYWLATLSLGIGSAAAYALWRNF